MTVIASLGGIFRLCQVFGILPFKVARINGFPRFAQSKARLAHTKTIFGLYFLVQLYLIWHSVSRGYVTEKALKVVLITSSLSAALSILVIFRSLITCEGVLCRWLNRINEMFSNLKESDLKWVKTISITSLSGTATFLTVLAVFEVYRYEVVGGRAENFFHKIYLVAPCFYMSMWHIKLFLQVQLVLVSLVRFHYQEVHETIRETYHPNGVRDREFWLEYIRGLRVRHLEIQDFLDFVQSFFMPVTSFRLVWGFFNLLFNIMMTAKTGIPSLVSVIWMFFIFFDVVIIVCVCHMTEQEGGKTTRYLQEKFIGWSDKEIWDEIVIFSLQVQHMKIEFTALGVHKINLTLLYDMVGSLTSTAVVLLQFQNETFMTKEFCTTLMQNLTSEENEIMLLHSVTRD